ncbi:hypothetical protein QTL86_13600 [Cellulosilyticum sp. ST5]|uniref:hypothetical protein n=1 Tax=Cellulosilyticum sp. ST5 TaxID=3055805 RepID=UPI003977AA18
MNKEKTFKDVEGMLYAYTRTKAEAKDIDLEIEEMKESFQGINGKSDNEIMQSTPTNKTGDPVADEVLRRTQEIDRLLKIKRSKERYIERIDNMLTTLSDEEQEFVRLKYILGRKGKDMMSALNVSKDGMSSKRKIIVSSLVNFLNNTKNTPKTH